MAAVTLPAATVVAVEVVQAAEVEAAGSPVHRARGTLPPAPTAANRLKCRSCLAERNLSSVASAFPTVAPLPLGTTGTTGLLF